MDTLNKWIAIGANVGLIAGLVLVVLQLRQNADLARIQLVSDNIAGEQAAEVAMLGDSGAMAWAKSIEDPATLTTAEIKVVDSYLVNQVLQWSRVRLLEDEGLLEHGATEAAIKATIRFYFGNRFAKTWWRYEKQNDYDPEFVKMIDKALEDLEDHENRRWLDRLKGDISDQQARDGSQLGGDTKP